MIRNPALEERRAQLRAQGIVITGPERPIIGCRAHQKKRDPANAARVADFYQRWHGQKDARLQLWAG